MLNQLQSHHITHDTAGAIPSLNGGVYHSNLTNLETYFEARYGPPLSGSKPSSFQHQSGIMLLKQSSENAFVLWNGENAVNYELTEEQIQSVSFFESSSKYMYNVFVYILIRSLSIWYYQSVPLFVFSLQKG